MLSATRYKMSRARMLHFLEELKADSSEVSSLCVPPGSSKANVEGLLETLVGLSNLPEDLVKYFVESATGGILFWGDQHRYLVIPPFPIAQEKVSATCEIEPLYSLLRQDFLLALVLVRLGAYGIGVCQGEKLISSKVGTGLVHARHRQGGSSSHRFERHRYKQMETFFTRVGVHAREQLEPYSRQFDYLIYGGARETILEFRKQVHFMQQFDKVTLDRLLDIREPKQSGLEEAVREAWSCRIIRWDEK